MSASLLSAGLHFSPRSPFYTLRPCFSRFKPSPAPVSIPLSPVRSSLLIGLFPVFGPPFLLSFSFLFPHTTPFFIIQSSLVEFFGLFGRRADILIPYLLMSILTALRFRIPAARQRWSVGQVGSRLQPRGLHASVPPSSGVSRLSFSAYLLRTLVVLFSGPFCAYSFFCGSLSFLPFRRALGNSSPSHSFLLSPPVARPFAQPWCH